MTRRSLVLIAAILALVGAALLSTLPAGASRSNAVDPHSVDPHVLRLDNSSLPAGAHIDYEGVSDNNDADGNYTPPPPASCPTLPQSKCVAQTHQAHQELYETEGRITGYRMDLSYNVQGTLVGSEYLGSIYGSAAQTKATFDEVTGPNSVLRLVVGATELPQPCNAGEECKAFQSPNPYDTSKRAVFAIFHRGFILVEMGSQVPVANFDALEPSMAQTLYSLLNAADIKAQAAINGPGQPTDTPVTATAVSPTDTAVPTDTAIPTPKPKKKCKKGQTVKHGKCVCKKKGYVVKKGKCVKKKRKKKS